MYDFTAIKPKPVTVMLDKERHLMLDLNALAELEDMYGSHVEALTQVEAGSFKALRAALWAALLHEDKDITLHEAGALVTSSGVRTVCDALSAAFGAAVPTEPATVNHADEAAADAQDF
ncbi:MAG: hypothetical protein ACI3XY_04465 [Butyricicoccaceae bacterium]